jgi:hypothetical protein
MTKAVGSYPDEAFILKRQRRDLAIAMYRPTTDGLIEKSDNLIHGGTDLDAMRLNLGGGFLQPRA